jgi:hypothetical protein
MTTPKAGEGSVVDLDSILGFVPVGRTAPAADGFFDWLVALPPPVVGVAADPASLTHYHNWLIDAHATWFRENEANAGAQLETAALPMREKAEGEILVAWEGARPAAPVNKDIPNVSGDAVVGGVLHCTMGNWEGVPASYAYAWSGAGGAGADYAVSDADAGTSITCVVTATNPLGSTAAPPSNAVSIPAAGGSSATAATASHHESRHAPSASAPKADDKKK